MDDTESGTAGSRAPDTAPGRWRLVLPMKAALDAKSRLTVGPGVARAELARAMALDTLAAAVAASLVRSALVVTSDPETGHAARALGAEVVTDPGLGLNAAIRHGADVLRAAGPGPVAALLADLPALTPEELDVALAACAGRRAAYLPDAEGTGTVLLAAHDPADLEPSFGGASAARHDRLATRLDLDLPRLRRDVDVAESLGAAVALGVGPRTTAVVAAADTRWLA